jgi:pyridoxal phosphate enzyme (YggS family)
MVGAMSYAEVVERIERACVRAGRDTGDVSLLVVSKGRTPSQIGAVYGQGHRDFGENRAQELRDKVGQVPDDIRWHFIGPLQTNKVRIVRPAVVALHSLDRESLAVAWMKGQGSPPPAYIEVNIGREPQKAGIDPDELPGFCDRLADLGVPLLGLMAIPPQATTPEEVRPHFAELRSLRDRLQADHPSLTGLSMGMTDDFEVAIEEGSTVIRIGRAIFSD